MLALLGPTNTGKTHRAVERMLEHETGMLGLPLRLLAREVYDRVSAKVGEAQVALITGEEKRVPPRPAYFICTVEAMPVDLRVDFLAVDEIQLAAHRERGHVFSDRLLAVRGRLETWFLGADTVRPLLVELVPDARVERHPRLSRLHSIGSTTLGQLPPRSAVVAFSLARVYEIAERLRRRRGGAAVVLGALSPRARNAQVAMFQSGEVDHMVATDAIGMGLNLDLDHVAFADLEKFDGKRPRPLEPAELAQIAGRAGRYQNDGSFSTLAPLPPLPERVRRAIERHSFDAERQLVWRSRELDFTSLQALVASLRRPPPHAALKLVEQADDFSALTRLARDPELVALAGNEERLRLLWDTCQIPDFRQRMPEAHARTVRDIFFHLAARGHVEREHLRRQVSRLDDASGDIETLLARMAEIRTWTYVSNHASWVEEPEHWQATTQGIEDRLSDALHERLVERFVERARPSKLRALPTSGPWAAAFARANVDGAFAHLLSSGAQAASKPASEDAWAAELSEAAHHRFQLDASGRICADERTLGMLTPGADLVHPEARVLLGDALSAGTRARLQRRLVAFARDVVSELFDPLHSPSARALSASARGLSYQLERNLGTLLVQHAVREIEALTAEDRAVFRQLGVVLGRRAVYLRSALGPDALAVRAALWNAGRPLAISLPSEPTIELGRTTPELRAALLSIGFLTLGGRAIRVDVADPPGRRRRKRRRRAARPHPPSAE